MKSAANGSVYLNEAHHSATWDQALDRSFECNLVLNSYQRRTEQFAVWWCLQTAEVPLDMKVLVLAVLFGSLLFCDLERKGESRVRLSEGAGNRLVKYWVQPRCPDDSCVPCGDAEVVLQLVVGRSGTVKHVAMVRAPDSRLAEAAMNAVKHWRYERYVLNGSPVEYETYTTIKSWMCGT
jgi:hypothetical protein